MGSLITTTVDYFGRIPHNRIVTGPLYVIARNQTGKDDFFDACFENWAPAQTNGGTDEDIPAELMTSNPFKSAGNPPDDPSSGSGAGQLRTGRDKSIGDYDVCMFHVTTAGCLGDAIPVTSDASPPSGAGGTNTENHYWLNSELESAGFSASGTPAGTASNTWADSWIHPKCQSFVRYTLLSRHNNSYGHDNDYWNYSSSGMERKRYFYDADPTSGGNEVSLVQPSSNATDTANDVLATDKMVNTGKFSVGTGTNQSFGSDLSTIGNNTWFSPVNDIEIFGYHAFNAAQYSQSNGGVTLYRSPAHNVTSYDLVVRIKFFSYLKSSDSLTYVDFVNRVNIFYQPFGETGQVRFETSSHSS